MPRDAWTFLESGASGWTTITLPAIPNPNTVPITDILKSTQKKFDLADGGKAYITPETKYENEPVEFSWYYQSGALLADKFKNISQDNTFFKVQSHIPDKEWVGKITEVKEKLQLRGRTDYRDVTITLEQQDD
jgi:hypothetical protein